MNKEPVLAMSILILKILSVQLNKHKVEYCIKGTYAVSFYASPRYTCDGESIDEGIFEDDTVWSSDRA